MTATPVLAAALAFPILTCPAQAQSGPVRPEALPVHVLEAAYLACDRATSIRQVDELEMIWCAQVSDELLRRSFGGDFDRMIAWWREEKTRAPRPSNR